MKGHKQKITNKAGTVAAPVTIVKQGIENITNLIYCPQELKVVSAVKLVYTRASCSV